MIRTGRNDRTHASLKVMIHAAMLKAVDVVELYAFTMQVKMDVNESVEGAGTHRDCEC